MSALIAIELSSLIAYATAASLYDYLTTRGAR